MTRLKAIHGPVVTGIPPTNAFRDLMVLPDGEIRHYGYRGVAAKGSHTCIYLASRDHGLSWSEHDTPLKHPGAAVRSPWSGNWLTVMSSLGHISLEEYQDVHQGLAPGTYVHRSAGGPDGPWTSERICDEPVTSPRQPLALRNKRRWLVSGQLETEGRDQVAVVLLSDDDGRAWRMVRLPALPRFKVAWPHKGMRWWRPGAEPTVVELRDGGLYMLIRTAHDKLWESWSEDGGDTWRDPAPSRFTATITTPLLHSLPDGRLLVVWHNTRPLPELDHDLQPELNDDGRTGIWEDLFTNRDAVHAALSDDDGKTWRGFRELLLNERRNDADFRSSGGSEVSIDKGLNQPQAADLPEGKVLVAVGQHPRCRRLLIFSPDWLLEEERYDDFRHGFDNWSVHQYYKGLTGGYRGFSGHCALNRRVGPALVPDPDGRSREVLRIARHPDPRLLDERQGAVWNFPAGRQGRVRIRLQLPKGSAGARIALLDHWCNPTDPVPEAYCGLLLNIDGSGHINGMPDLAAGQWHQLTVQWSLEGHAEFRVDDGTERALEWLRPCPDGLSYLLLQSTAAQADPHGLLVEEVGKGR